MTEAKIIDLFDGIKSGKISKNSAVELLKNYPFADLGHTKLDTQRELRNGASEVIYGAGKSSEEILEISQSLANFKKNILITRTDEITYLLLKKKFSNAEFNQKSKTITIMFNKPIQTLSYIAIVSAGTSDGYVVEEAYETAKFLGNSVIKVCDVGVAGIHRLFLKLDEIKKAKVVIVVAGMEGALPSVVAGLVSSPVIAVPTSVGYGANFGGISALLGMLNSCANSVTVVNIDNGYGAAYNASLINHL